MTRLTRRHFVVTGAASAAALAAGRSAAQDTENPFAIVQESRDASETSRRNISSFQAQDWRPYFDSIGRGAILCDMTSRVVHFWGRDDTYRLYPSSVPLTEELTRRGRTEVIRKVEGPSWAPTPSMRERNPEWPEFVGPGPDNPLGSHALYLSWQYYRIHGTHDTRKIGRQSSNGCIGLYNQHIEELYGLAPVGTQVLLI
ncbi:MAG: L,D-transpeptidase [Paracoccaceae bacterium]